MKPPQESARRPRLVPRHGERQRVVSVGRPRWGLRDVYARLLDASWTEISAVVALLYVMINVIFASAYLSTGGIDNAKAGSFIDMFFFSVQTMATIGYGKLVPLSFAANALVSLEALFGFGFFAVTCGLIFAKVSRPTARVLFSEVAVVGPFNGAPHLMLRMANQRDNRIVNASVQVVMLRIETTQEGQRMRRFYDLDMVRRQIPFLQLTWTLMHPIDTRSPLYGLDRKTLCEQNAEIVVSLTGLDETFMQTVHARHSYVAEEIVWDAAFADVLTRREDGGLEINYHRFHEVRGVKNG